VSLVQFAPEETGAATGLIASAIAASTVGADTSSLSKRSIITYRYFLRQRRLV